MSAGRSDLLELRIGDAHARPGVDQHQLPLQRRQPRRILDGNGIEQRANAEPPGALALELDLGNRPFDDLEADRPACDVLRRHDGAAEVEAGGAVDVADPGRNGHEIGLRDLLADEGHPGAGEAIGRDGMRAG